MSDDSKSREELIEELAELRRQLSELKDSEEHFTAIMEVTTDFIFTKDLDCKYTYVNRAMTELFGCQPEDLIGKTPEEIFDPEYAKVVNEVDKLVLECKIANEIRTILLVDDEESILSIGKQMLERIGFDVLTACDGREALSRFREHSDMIDLVILDLTMPHLDGEEAFRELRRIRRNIRVLMSSGYNEQEVTQRFSGKPLAGFLQKPYVFTELRARIQEILEK